MEMVPTRKHGHGDGEMLSSPILSHEIEMTKRFVVHMLRECFIRVCMEPPAWTDRVLCT